MASEFLEKLFEFNYCDECGKDADEHTEIEFMGNPFAVCNNPPKEPTTMKATPDNMRKVLARYNEEIAVRNVVAYSFETEEETSASPGDYYMMPGDECLKDSEGFDMVLVRRIVTTVMQPIEE